MRAKKVRPLLFVIAKDEGAIPQTISTDNLSDPVREVLRCVFLGIDAAAGNPTTERAAKEAAKYDLYDWNGSPLPVITKVRAIPKPGVIFAIERVQEDPSHCVRQLRVQLELSTDGKVRKAVDTLLFGPPEPFEPNEYDVFLSYSAKDSSLARELRQMIEDNGLSCFLAEKSLKPGTHWQESVREALTKSIVVVVLLTPNSINSHWVIGEAGACWVLQKTLVPALTFVKISELPEFITESQCTCIDTTESRVDICNTLKNLCN